MYGMMSQYVLCRQICCICIRGGKLGKGKEKRAWQDLNPQPLDPKSSALSIELQTHMFGTLYTLPYLAHNVNDSTMMQ